MRRLGRTVSILLGLGLAAALAGCAMQLYSPPGQTTTVVMVRHAERLHLEDNLNDDGRVRAAALPAAVADLDIAAIYSPDLQRNLDTARPLAERRGIEIVLSDPLDAPERMLAEYPGQTVLWVGNTTNLGYIFRRLGGGEGAPPNAYGDIYILKVPDSGDTQVIKRRFGGAARRQ